MNIKPLQYTKRKCFEGELHQECPPQWEARVGDQYWLSREILECCKWSDTPFFYVIHKDYMCCEYRRKINIFTFGKAKLEIPVTVIGLPVSVDKQGYSGNLEALIEDYKRRKGFFLVLNIEEGEQVPNGQKRVETLGTCIFRQHFQTFDQYMDTLRGGYRRRLNRAMKKGENLNLKRIENGIFPRELHVLYEQVLHRSEYPLEHLQKEFFQTIPGEIWAFYKNEKPVAFFCVTGVRDCFHFVFGGMDYKERNSYDLYYNILIAILRKGIEGGYQTIDFGQTAEDTKCRLGCERKSLYMTAFCSCSWINKGLQRVVPMLAYRGQVEAFRVYRER